MQVDVLIFGGGAAGLWLLDDLTRRGARALLLEADRLGAGQTIASQGIIHGGLKYTLQGALTPSAVQIRDMPGLWRDCLAGVRQPDLRGVRLRASHCHLWRTDSLGSRLGMMGARVGLRVAPQIVADDERPAALSDCPGRVARLDEPVLAPNSLLQQLLVANASRVLAVSSGSLTPKRRPGVAGVEPPGEPRGIEALGAARTPTPATLTPSDRPDMSSELQIELASPGMVRSARIANLATGGELNLAPRHVVLAAGRGNAELRRRCGLDAPAMQSRPLHMVLVRGDLPLLNGHCVDGRATRVTITSDKDDANRTVWQVGGQIAEIGVELDERSLLARAVTELQAVIPGIDLKKAEWASYRVDRAEQATPGGSRPESIGILCEGNVITAWPTKLALVPYLAEQVLQRLGAMAGDLQEASAEEAALCDTWPRPQVAPLPWEIARAWLTTSELGPISRRKAA